MTLAQSTNLLGIPNVKLDYRIIIGNVERFGGPIAKIAEYKHSGTPGPNIRQLWSEVIESVGHGRPMSEQNDFITYIFAAEYKHVAYYYIGKTTSTLWRRYGKEPPKKKQLGKIIDYIERGERWAYTVYNNGQPSLFEDLCVQLFYHRFGRSKNGPHRLLNITSTA